MTQEVAIIDCLSQLAREDKSHRIGLITFGGIHCITARAPLGCIHSDVCAAHQRGSVGTMLRKSGDADTGPDFERFALDLERFPKSFDDSSCGNLCPGLIGPWEQES